MAIINTRIKTLARVSVIVLALGTTATTMAPAMAQDTIPGFSLQIPGAPAGDAQTFDEGTQRHGGNWNNDQGRNYRCLTNREVRQGIAAYGFRRVEIIRELNRDRVEVRAVYRNWLYSMRVDKCTGEVTRVRPLRRAGGFDGGFGLEFNFGN